MAPLDKRVKDFKDAFDALNKQVIQIEHSDSISSLNPLIREARQALMLVQFRSLELARWVEDVSNKQRQALTRVAVPNTIDVAHTIPVEDKTPMPVKISVSKKTKLATKKKIKSATKRGK